MVMDAHRVHTEMPKAEFARRWRELHSRVADLRNRDGNASAVESALLLALQSAVLYGGCALELDPSQGMNREPFLCEIAEYLDRYESRRR